MKIAIITDTHYGARKGSKHLHEYFEKFYKDIFFPELEKNNIDSARELLASHLLTWSPVYLDKLNTASDLSFYKKLSIDVINWLNQLTSGYNLNVATKKLYID